MKTKICPKCKREKPATSDFFPRRNDRPCGLMSRCKICNGAKAKAYAATVPGYHAAWHKKDREAHLERYRRYDRDRYVRDRPKRLQRAIEYQARNLDKVRLVQENRRAKKLGSGWKLTAADIERMWTEQEGRCAYCSAMLKDGYHIEHKTPFIRGGAHSPENICLACKTCNLKKHIMTAEEFIAARSA